MNERLAKLALITENMINTIPEIEGKEELITWLNNSPYSPYVTLYGGENSLSYDESKSFISELDGKKRYLLEDEISFKLENFINHDDAIYSANTSLSNVINAEELFKAYPEFKDIEISINISNADNGFMTGSTHHSNNEAQRIEVYATTNSEAMRVLVHELQHCIQLNENFAIGESYYNEHGVMDLFVGSHTDEEGNYKDGSFSDIATQKTMVEIDDSDAKISFPNRKKLVNSYSGELGNILEHDELYQLYPYLKNTKVYTTTDDALKASYNGNHIFIRESLLKDGLYNKNDLSALLHEIQHAIQHKEGWAFGGNEEMFEEIDLSEIERRSLINQVREYIDFNFNSGTDEYRNAIRMINSGSDPEKGREILQNNPEYKAEYASYYMAYKDLDEIKNKEYKPNYLTKFEQYQKLWGEQQARAVQYRMGMSEEERLKESWTDTLARVEGEYHEPIINFTASVMEAKELTDKYGGKIIESDSNDIQFEDLNMDALKDHNYKFPKHKMNTTEEFKNIGFHEYGIDSKTEEIDSFECFPIDTPIGKVYVDLDYAFQHLTVNTNGENRHSYANAFYDVLKNPLFVVANEYDGEKEAVFYKPYDEKHINKKNKEVDVTHLATFAIDKNGLLKKNTFYSLDRAVKVKRLLNVEDEELLYFKHSSPTQRSHSFANIKRFYSSDKVKPLNVRNKSLAKKNKNVKKKDKESIKYDRKISNYEKRSNLKTWLGKSKAMKNSDEPLVLYWDKSGNVEEGYHLYENKPSVSFEPVYLKIEKAHKVLGKSITEKDVAKAKEIGCDGIIKRSSAYGNKYIAFDSRQIKSIHNQGTFEVNNPNIMEKNDLGLREVEKVLSIIPHGTKLDAVKSYLDFNGVSRINLRKHFYQGILDNPQYISPFSQNQFKEVSSESSYYQNKGETESREIENLYANKLDDVDMGDIQVVSDFASTLDDDGNEISQGQYQRMSF